MSRAVFHFNTSPKLGKDIRVCSSKKATKTVDISAINRKSSVETYLPKLTRIFNNLFNKGKFPDELKLADGSPVFKNLNNQHHTNTDQLTYY